MESVTAGDGQVGGTMLDHLTRPSDPPERSSIRVLVGLVVMVLVAVILMLADAQTPVPFVGWYLLSSVVPATAIAAFRPGRWIVPVGLAVVVVPLVLLTASRLGGDDGFDRQHDGGVVATRAAARMVIDGENPYTADFTAALSPDHHRLAKGQPAEQANPLVDHFPYLPLAFLVQVPVEVVTRLIGVDSDPRWFYAACFAALVVMASRTCRPAWARGAALWALGANAAVAVYLPWGANDTAAAALVVVAAYQVKRRPLIGGGLLALAVSLKALLAVALLPLAVLLLAAVSAVPGAERAEGSGADDHPGAPDGRVGGGTVAAGWTTLRRAALAFAVTMAVTCGPFMVMAPGDFLEDTVKFNLGMTELEYPASGIGLAANFPDVVTSGVMIALSVLLLVVVAAVGLRFVRERPTEPAALLVTAGLVLAGLIPARTFQVSYLPVPVVLAAMVWLDLGRPGAAGPSAGSRSG